MSLRRLSALGLTAVTAIGLAACDATSSGKETGAGQARAAAPADISSKECGTFSGRGCAPSSRRLDTATPKFSSKSTEITNPLFPISRLHSVVLLGKVDGKPFRAETTLLPGTETVAWAGQRVRVLRSQYTAYLDGRLDEVALDRYAQADDGSVWYLGEDVFDYREGAAAITEGTWLAGREGPAAMIMPAKPKAGDVFRPENVTGVVFEEVTVKQVGKTVKGPRGPVRGAMVARELHLDGSHSDKVFAPGFGEFYTASDGEVEALALALPEDALSDPVPAELTFLSTAAGGVLENARLRDWEAAAATARRMRAAWKTLQADQPPRLVAAQMRRGLRALSGAVRAHRVGRASQASVDVGQSALDLQLRHRPAAEIDVERFHLHTQQLRVHAAAKDVAGVTGEVAVLEWIRDRIVNRMPAAARAEIDTRLRGLRTASDARNLPAAGDHAARLGARVRALAAPQRPGA